MATPNTNLDAVSNVVNVILDQPRADIFAQLPGLSDYVGTMLEDAQLSENDEACSEGREARDTGTIYTLNRDTFDGMVRNWARFRIEAGPLLFKVRDTYSLAEAGSDLWLYHAGHGADFRDRDALGIEPVGGGDSIAQRLCDRAARVLGTYNPSPYFGDDGAIYLA